MTTIRVNDMMCNHCVMHITKAIQDKDPKAKVQCNLNDKTVIVDSSLEELAICNAIKDAGYTPEKL